MNTRMRCVALLLGLALSSCQSVPVAPPSVQTEPAEELEVPTPPVAIEDSAEPPTAQLGQPLTGPPRLVIENHSTGEIDIYAAYIVDEQGKLDPKPLWPHRSDCPEHERERHVLPKGGVYDYPAPTHAYDGCKEQALPPGRYVVRFDSGYGSELFAAATIELPLKEPVRLLMKPHEAKDWPCDPRRAQRAARLLLKQVQIEPIGPTDFFKACRAEEAQCGTLPLPDPPAAPPTTCEITLHEELVRVRLPPKRHRPLEMTGWMDRAGVFVQRPDLNATSGDVIDVGGAKVVLQGETAQHRHEHGGNAAGVGHMTIHAHNPTGRTLSYQVKGVEWMTDSQCGLPTTLQARPAVPPSMAKGNLPPGHSTITVGYAVQSAYQVHCDRFASRASLLIDGKPASITVEHAVTRFDRVRLP